MVFPVNGRKWRAWSQRVITWICGGPQVALVVKNLPASVGDRGDPNLIPESGRFPGGENGSPLQYSGLENPMDRRFYEANSCISSYLEMLSNHSWWWLVFMTIRTLLQKICALLCTPFHQNHMLYWLPSTSLEQYLRALWDAISRAFVLILHQIIF